MVFDRIFYHGTPSTFGQLEPRESRIRGIFLVEDERIARCYAGERGRVIPVKIRPGTGVLDASGTYENDNWHTPSQEEWQRFLATTQRHGIEVRQIGYQVLRDSPLTWEAILDPIDGLGKDPRLSSVLRDLGYGFVLTSDFSGAVVGDIFQRFGQKSVEKIRQVLPRGEVPVAISLGDEFISQQT